MFPFTMNDHNCLPIFATCLDKLHPFYMAITVLWSSQFSKGCPAWWRIVRSAITSGNWSLRRQRTFFACRQRAYTFSSCYIGRNRFNFTTSLIKGLPISGKCYLLYADTLINNWLYLIVPWTYNVVGPWWYQVIPEAVGCGDNNLFKDMM